MAALAAVQCSVVCCGAFGCVYACVCVHVYVYVTSWHGQGWESRGGGECGGAWIAGGIHLNGGSGSGCDEA